MSPVRRMVVCLFWLMISSRAAFTQSSPYAYAWGHPRPHGNTIHGFAFSDSLTGWAVAGNGYILRTTDGGLTWEIQRYTDDDRRHLYDIVRLQSGTLIAAGYQDVLLRSTNGGLHWQDIDHPVAGDLRDLAEQSAFGITAAGENGTLLLSTDDGISWHNIGPGGTGDARHHVWRSPMEGFVVGTGGLFSRTTDGGTSWATIGHQSSFGLNEIVFTSPDTALVFDDFKVWRSVDGGANWTDWEDAQVAPYHYRTIAHTSQHLLGVNFGEGGEVVESTDGGMRWELLSFRSVIGYPCLAQAPGGRVFIGSDIGDLLYSDDQGHTLANSAVNLTTATGASVLCFGRRSDGVLFAANQPTTFLETQTWMRSDDGGLSWTVPDSHPGLRWVSDVDFSDDAVGLACYNEQIRFTTDGGLTWGSAALPSIHRSTKVAVPAPNRLFVGTYITSQYNGGLFISADSGRTWSSAGGGFPASGFRVWSLEFVDELTGYVGGDLHGIPSLYRTTDGGATWDAVAITGLPGNPRDMAWLDPQTGLAALYQSENGGIYRTTDGGLHWSLVSHEMALKLEFQNDQWGAALGTFYGFLETEDGGLTWQLVEPPIGGGFGLMGQYPADVSAIIQGENGWVLGGASNRILVAGRTTTNVGNRAGFVGRRALHLVGAYPNPFNPSTTIRFAVDRPGRIRLSVFNVLGQEIRLLADGPRSVGVHEIEWDGRNRVGAPVASGVYFVRLTNEGSADVAKVMLIK